MTKKSKFQNSKKCHLSSVMRYHHLQPQRQTLPLCKVGWFTKTEPNIVQIMYELWSSTHKNYWCFYTHRSRDLVAPVRGIFLNTFLFTDSTVSIKILDTSYFFLKKIFLYGALHDVVNVWRPDCLKEHMKTLVKLPEPQNRNMFILKIFLVDFLGQSNCKLAPGRRVLAAKSAIS